MKPLLKCFVLTGAIFLAGVNLPLHSQSTGFTSDLSRRGDRTSFIVYGDPQRTGFWERMLFREQNDTARQRVADRIAAEDPAFLVILGDLVSTGGMQSRWEYFDHVTRAIRDRGIPAFAIPGNHEYFGKKGKGLEYLAERFPGSRNRVWQVVRYRSLALVLLNSNFTKMSPEEVDSQDVWYRRTLKELQNDDSVSNVIVACHHPPKTNSTIVSPNENVRRHFVDQFLRTPKARLFITGHCHSYERFEENGKKFVVTGGGGGARQKVIVDPMKQHFLDLFHAPAIRPFHYCKFLLGPGELRVQMVAIDSTLTQWSVLDDFTIDYGK